MISPHLDDAVLSMGEYLWHTPAIIVSVFAGVPGELPLTIYDVNSGFTSGEEAMTTRRAEDTRAALMLRSTTIHWDFFDRQYGVPTSLDDVVKRMRELFDSDQEGDVFVPLGLVHPDHQVVTQCALAALKRHKGRVLLYEDLPSRVLYPDSIAVAWADAESRGWKATGPEPSNRAVSEKQAAIHCYRSQLWGLDLHACLVPERIHQVEHVG